MTVAPRLPAASRLPSPVTPMPRTSLAITGSIGSCAHPNSSLISIAPSRVLTSGDFIEKSAPDLRSSKGEDFSARLRTGGFTSQSKPTDIRSPEAMITYAHPMPAPSTTLLTDRGTTTPITIMDAILAAVALTSLLRPTMSRLSAMSPGILTDAVMPDAIAKTSACHSSMESVNMSAAITAAPIPLDSPPIWTALTFTTRSMITPSDGREDNHGQPATERRYPDPQRRIC